MILFGETLLADAGRALSDDDAARLACWRVSAGDRDVPVHVDFREARIELSEPHYGIGANCGSIVEDVLAGIASATCGESALERDVLEVLRELGEE